MAQSFKTQENKMMPCYDTRTITKTQKTQDHIVTQSSQYKDENTQEHECKRIQRHKYTK